MVPSSPERPGDPLFALLVGLYVALLVIAPTAFAVARFVSGDAAVLYATAIATATGVTGLGWWATERFGTPARLGATRTRWLLGLVGIGYAVTSLFSLGWAGGFGVLAMFSGMGAAALGGVVGVMARTRYTDAALDGVDAVCEFRAGWPVADRRRLGFVAAGVVVTAMASFLAGILSERFLLQMVGQLLLPLGIVAYSLSEKRRYTVSPVGLEQRLPVARRLFGWGAFAGYTRTEDALVLRRRWRPDARFALADLGDPDAVERALAQYLDSA
jgi:hypothetical protein